MNKNLESNSTTATLHENNEPTLQTRMHHVAVQIASSGIGQTLMMQFDRWLWALEKTATWISNGKTGNGKRVKTSIGLVRPLPWVFFLPTLVALRLARVLLSLIAICIGYDEIEASTVVSFLHKSRRNIRYILVQAKRNNKTQISYGDYVKRITLTLLTQLKNFLSLKPNEIDNKTTNKMKYNNKTALNALIITETENDDRTISQSEDSDLEDEMYRNLLKSDFASSESDDKDYIYEEMSDDDSETGTATDDFSDDDSKTSSNEAQFNGTNGNSVHFVDSKYAADSDTIATETENIAAVEQSEKLGDLNSKYTENTKTAVDEQSKKDLTESQTSDKENNSQNDADDRFFSEEKYAKDAARNSGKNINRPQQSKIYRKNQNGKQFNGAHGQTKSKTISKHHQIETTTGFIADAAADRT